MCDSGRCSFFWSLVGVSTSLVLPKSFRALKPWNLLYIKANLLAKLFLSVHERDGCPDISLPGSCPVIRRMPRLYSSCNSGYNFKFSDVYGLLAWRDRLRCRASFHSRKSELMLYNCVQLWQACQLCSVPAITADKVSTDSACETDARRSKFNYKMESPPAFCFSPSHPHYGQTAGEKTASGSFPFRTWPCNWLAWQYHYWKSSPTWNIPWGEKCRAISLVRSNKDTKYLEKGRLGGVVLSIWNFIYICLNFIHILCVPKWNFALLRLATWLFSVEDVSKRVRCTQLYNRRRDGEEVMHGGGRGSKGNFSTQVESWEKEGCLQMYTSTLDV